jgi:hypothetical protein
MTHPIILEALAAARRDDLFRAVDRNRGVVLSRATRRRRTRLTAWLKAQLHHPAPAAGVTAASPCVAAR